MLPEIAPEWGLSASQAGWIGGIYFGGYAACVPLLASATDKIDARWMFLGCSLLGAVASFAFAGFAHGFCVLSESADVVYKCTTYYAPAAERVSKG